jgi:hypothetical protein
MMGDIPISDDEKKTSDVDAIEPMDEEPLDQALKRKQVRDEERRNKLDPIHVAFVNHFFDTGMDIPKAAERTGVPVAKAREWVQEEGPVADYIQRRLAKMSEETDVSIEEIIRLLYREATREPEGPEDKTISHGARVSALDKLARLKGGYDKTGSGASKVNVNINMAPPQESGQEDYIDNE